MDNIAKKMMEIEWYFADKDLEALTKLEDSIRRRAEKSQLITYSELVEGVIFKIPTVNNGKPYQIITHDWSNLDRLIIGDFLGYISTRSYIAHGFMASALVVSKSDDQPSDHFFQFMYSIGAISNKKPNTVFEFWIGEVKKAYAWYKSTSN